MCLDDEGIREILPKISKPVVTYGVHEDADIRAVDISQNGMLTTYSVLRKGNYPTLRVTLNMPGWHNMLNSLAAIAVATKLAVSDDAIISSLAVFKGVGRRFQVNGDLAIDGGKITLVDDYGHHPKEISATLEALHQAWPERRSVIIFQPHRYTRTRDLFEDFVQILSTVDVLILMDVYPAGETVITGADGRALSRAIRMRAQVDPIFVDGWQELPTILAGIVKPEDVILTMGAGNVGQFATQLPKLLTEALENRVSSPLPLLT
jgi:UDP-N-acetylmuramate--alanine ligase